MIAFNFIEWFNGVQLLNELDSENADKAAEILQNMESNPYTQPLPEIFGRKNRFVVDFVADKVGSSILSKFKDDGYLLDFSSGMAKKGDRSIRIGKLLLDKKSGFSEEQKSWWNRQGNAVLALKDVASQSDKYAILISRNPYDVIRMSDHRKMNDENRLHDSDSIHSCHSPDGGYFYCAVDDATHGGAIAYVVNKSDLVGVDLDAPEVFYDKERNVRGIVPLSRIRIRRFSQMGDSDDSEMDFGVPERRVYGKNIPAFYQNLVNILKQKQSEFIKNFGGPSARPRMQDFWLRGGEYEDTAASDLFNSFFGDNLDSGETNKDGRDMRTIWDEEVKQINSELLGKIKNYKVEWQVVGTMARPHLDFTIRTQFVIKKSLFTDDFSAIFLNFSEEDLKHFQDKLEKIIDEIMNPYDETYYRFYGRNLPEFKSQVEINSDENNVYLNVKFKLPQTESYPDKYRKALERLESIDKDHHRKLNQLIYKIKNESKIIKNSKFSEENKDFVFKHFTFGHTGNKQDLELHDKPLVMKNDIQVFDNNESKYSQYKKILDSIKVRLEKIDNVIENLYDPAKNKNYSSVERHLPDLSKYQQRVNSSIPRDKVDQYNIKNLGYPLVAYMGRIAEIFLSGIRKNFYQAVNDFLRFSTTGHYGEWDAYHATGDGTNFQDIKLAILDLYISNSRVSEAEREFWSKFKSLPEYKKMIGFEFNFNEWQRLTVESFGILNVKMKLYFNSLLYTDEENRFLLNMVRYFDDHINDLDGLIEKYFNDLIRNNKFILQNQKLFIENFNHSHDEKLIGLEKHAKDFYTFSQIPDRELTSISTSTSWKHFPDRLAQVTKENFLASYGSFFFLLEDLN